MGCGWERVRASGHASRPRTSNPARAKQTLLPLWHCQTGGAVAGRAGHASGHGKAFAHRGAGFNMGGAAVGNGLTVLESNPLAPDQ